MNVKKNVILEGIAIGDKIASGNVSLIKNLNESHFIKIHTISIGESSDFLKNVAEDNYGTYTEIK